MSPTRPFVRTPASLKPSSRSSPSARDRGSLSPRGSLGCGGGRVLFASRLGSPLSFFVPSANFMFPSFPAEGLILSRGVRRHGQNLFGQICAVIAFLRLRAAGGLRADLRTFPPTFLQPAPPAAGSAEARVRGIERAHEVFCVRAPEVGRGREGLFGAG